MLNSFEKDSELLANIQAGWSDPAKLLEEMNSHWGYEDPIYRFYHQSFKVYALQSETRRIVGALQNIAPAGTTFCSTFQEIYEAELVKRNLNPSIIDSGQSIPGPL